MSCPIPKRCEGHFGTRILSAPFFELNLLINNIFNELYEPNGYTFSYFVLGGNGRKLVTENFYYPQAGANLLLGLRMKF